ncbi:MAG: molybdopterin-dependent oxidoreductase [Xanthobacteraceae bacterium]|nr:molybdopterin-dependent oxidoreductase [Xanthobacteraceae bacterium]
MTILATSARSALKSRKLSRRQVMVGAAGFTFALALPSTSRAAVPASERVGQALNPWLSIAPDGTITIMSAATEMGQGSMTSLPLVLAEELDADWSKVRVVPVPPIDRLYANPAYGMIYTAGSNAVRVYFQPMRTFGAQARRVLIDNAAKKLGVPVEELTTEPSVVVHAKSGRRLTYGEIAAFAEIPEKAPEIKPDQLKKPAQFRLIGKDVMRIEVPDKVNGRAQYAIDVQLPNMLYGAVLRAPVEGSGPERIDDAKARAIAGVVKVIRLPYGVGVVAETPWAAFDAKRALAAGVSWTKTAKAWGFDSDRGLEAFAAAARDLKQPSTDWFKAGDARAALGQATSTMDATYLSDYAYHAQMEPLNAVASVSASGDAAEIWTGTQSPTTAQEATARALGISRDQVKLNYFLMGGGFGRRGPRDSDFTVDAVLLAKDAGRPVKVMWTREDDLHNGRFRPLSAHYLRAGVDNASRLIAWHHRHVGDRVTPFFDPVRYEANKRRDGILMAGTELAGYDVPNQLVEQLYQDTGVRTAPLRGIGFIANKFATESFMDEVAGGCGIDPLKFRLDLLAKNPRARKIVERVAQMADWGRARPPGRALGLTYIDYSGTQVAGIAEISVDRTSGQIAVHDFWCTIDCGIAVQPDNVVAQTESSIVYGLGVALSERITIKDGVVQQSNFYDYRVPRLNEVPAMHIELIASDNAPTGVGQMATPLVAPAIGNALARLANIRLRHAPFTPERVKAALG